jgi:hypothetical protein
MFERRDVWVLGSEPDSWHPILRWYARAIIALKGRAQKDPTSWRYFAAIHGTRIPRSEWPQGGTETFQESFPDWKGALQALPRVNRDLQGQDSSMLRVMSRRSDGDGGDNEERGRI